MPAAGGSRRKRRPPTHGWVVSTPPSLTALSTTMKLRLYFATVSTALVASGCASETNAPAEKQSVSAVQAAASNATIVVTTTSDSGAGSLRDALARANAAAGADTISFQVTGTITITSPLPYVTDALTIVGPGADKLTIQAAPRPTSVSSAQAPPSASPASPSRPAATPIPSAAPSMARSTPRSPSQTPSFQATTR